MNRIGIISAMFCVICISAAAFAADLVSVDQRGLSFSTRTLQIRKGSIVTFMNNDNTSHNIMVTGNGVKLNSGLQRPGISFRAPFVKEGTYQVSCGIHPKMKMAVIVK